ncbi:MAG: LrgB family protein [Fusobacterium sp.]|nr:LrgB family protein [Fusobacterium sp.]
MLNPFGLLATIIIYTGALKFRKQIPVIILAGTIIICLLLLLKMDYATYNSSASLLTVLLGPATIALGYPLSQNIKSLTKNKRAIYFGLLFATVIAILLTYITGKLLHTEISVICSLIPKSVTTPIAVEISKTIGGIPELTACVVVLTGIWGAVTGHKILKLIGIKSDISIGLSIGASSHVMGTSSCIEKQKEQQTTISTLALIIVGILTTILAPVLLKLL